MISLTLIMVHFYSMSWMRRVCPEFTQGLRAGPGSTEGELLGRLGAILGTGFCVEPENTSPVTW